MPVPNTFANATTAIPLSQLDNNFATAITMGNTAVQLGNTITTMNNMTFANVTVSSVASTFPNNYLANSSITLGTTAVSLGSTGTTLNGLTLTNVTVSSVSATFPNNYLANSSVTLGNTALTLGSTVTSVGNLTLSNVTIGSGNVTANISNSSISNTSVGNAVSDSVNVTGYMGIPQNSQNGNYNIVLGDAGKHIYHPVAQAAATYTIPANSNVAFTTGTAITIINGSANNVSIAITSDTMTLANSSTTGTRTLVANGIATCVKVTSTSWIISGVGLS